jgi:hypothetical protein
MRAKLTIQERTRILQRLFDEIPVVECVTHVKVLMAKSVRVGLTCGPAIGVPRGGAAASVVVSAFPGVAAGCRR